MSRDVLTDAKSCFVGVHRLPFAPADIAGLKDELFAGRGDIFIGPDGVYEISPIRQTPTLLASRSVVLPTADQALESAHAALIDATFALLESNDAVAAAECLNSRFAVAPAPGSYHLKRRGGQVSLHLQDSKIASGPVSGWYGHCCRFWSRVRGRRDNFIVCLTPEMLSRGGACQTAIVRSAWPRSWR